MTEDSLDWLALQYVLDELPEPARGQFETRLINDLAACEAVARATRLKQGIEQSLAETESVIIHQDVARPSRRAPIAVAAAIVLLTAVFVVAVIIPRLPQSQLVNHPILNPMDRENVELVALWRTGMDLAEFGTESATNTLADETDEEFFDSTHDAALPPWLLAGVSIEMNERMEKRPSNQKDN